MESLVFWLAALGLVASAVGVVVARNPLRGALALMAGLGLLAVLYVLLDAPFVAVMQVLVYAGAVMVLFVLVIMLLHLGTDAYGWPASLAFSKLLGSVAAVYVGARIIKAAWPEQGAGQPVDGSLQRIGQLLTGEYVLGFEALSVLLLVAMVGVVVLGLKRLV